MKTLQDTAGKQYHHMTYRTWQGYRPHDLTEFSLQSMKSFFREKAFLDKGALQRAKPSAGLLSALQKDKKNPRIIKMIRGCPGESTYRCPCSYPRRKAVMFQAGILTPGSSSRRVFPTCGQ